MKILVPANTYTFNQAAATITFTSPAPASLGAVLHVTNATRGVLYFQPQAGAAFTGTLSGAVLTLSASTAGHNSADALEVFIDDGTTAAGLEGAAGDASPALPPGSTGSIGWARFTFDILNDAFRQLRAIAASVKPFNFVVDPTTQQVRVQVLNSITIGTLPTLANLTTLGTVTNPVPVGTVATLTNQTQLGGLSAAGLVADSINTRWATTVPARITRS